MKPGLWQAITDFSEKLDPDPEHALQVCRISLMLFDCLSDLHKLNEKERNLLKAASLLHDVGWSFPGKPHHKASRDWILSEENLPFNKNERIIVALIARYHRKSCPEPDHAYYCELNQEQKKVVLYLSGILRIADGLDRAHRKIVQSLHCIITPETIQIFLTTSTLFILDWDIFSEKAVLLESISKRRIYVKCN
ncbi:MAG: HD domain-containing protein [Methanomicrobiales archaeon]|nr:HD domain-containing protein [Methanomicrobiales archaeon]